MSEPWQVEFFRLMLNPHATRDEIDRAFNIKNENLPPRLYRYRPPHEHSIQELENDSVFITVPAAQNDPLDSICTLSPSEIFKTLIKARLPKLTDSPEITSRLTEEQIRLCNESEDPQTAVLDALIASEPPEQAAELAGFRQAFVQFTQKSTEEAISPLRLIAHQFLRICCFTTDYESTSMWDRYAQTHSGMCIAYDVLVLPLDDLRRRWLYPLVYRDTPFDITPFAMAAIEQGAVFPVWPALASIHKRSEWSNEKEWRLVVPPDDPATPRLMRLAKPAAVYLGARMDVEKQLQAEEIAHRRGITAFKMEISYQRGRMIAVPR